MEGTSLEALKQQHLPLDIHVANRGCLGRFDDGSSPVRDAMSQVQTRQPHDDLLVNAPDFVQPTNYDDNAWARRQSLTGTET